MALNPFIPISGNTHLTFRTNYNSNMTQAEARLSSLESISVSSGDNVSLLSNDALYVSSGDNVSLLANDAGYVTNAVQAGDNVSLLVNDTGYTLSGDNVSLFANDALYVASGDNISLLANDAGYITSAPAGGGGISLSGITTGTTQEEMFIDGVDQSRIDVTTGTSLTFSALVVGRRTDGGGTGSAGYEIKGLIKNDGGTTSFVGTPTKYVLGEDADWDATVSSDNANDALAFLVSGQAGADIEWRATVNKVEFTE